MTQIVANLVGVRVSWRVAEFLGEREELVAAANAAGLHGEWLPKNSMKKAVGRASKEIAKGANGRFNDALPTRKLTDNIEKAVYAIVAETVDSEKDHASYEQTTTVKLDKEKKSVSAEGAQAGEFMAKYEVYRDAATDHDIRAFCLLTVKKSLGIAYNPSGHDYFVPEAGAENMRKLDTFLRQIGVGRMYITPAIDDKDSLEVTWERASDILAKEIALVMSNVDKFEKRVKCLRDKTEQLNALKDMAKVYGGLTQRAAEAESVLETINAASDKVAQKIQEIEASR